MARDVPVPASQAREGEYGGTIHRGGAEPEAPAECERLGTAPLARWGRRMRRFVARNERATDLTRRSWMVLRLFLGDSCRYALMLLRQLPPFSPRPTFFDTPRCTIPAAESASRPRCIAMFCSPVVLLRLWAERGLGARTGSPVVELAALSDLSRVGPPRGSRRPSRCRCRRRPPARMS